MLTQPKPIPVGAVVRRSEGRVWYGVVLSIENLFKNKDGEFWVHELWVEHGDIYRGVHGCGIRIVDDLKMILKVQRHYQEWRARRG